MDNNRGKETKCGLCTEEKADIVQAEVKASDLLGEKKTLNKLSEMFSES